MEVGNIGELNIGPIGEFKRERTVESSPSDRVELSRNAVEIDRYAEKVKALPEVREDVVQEFKQKVEGGVYPPPVIIDGLANLLGGANFVDDSGE